MVVIYIILTILGLCFGSFAGALVWRIHEQSLPRKKRKASDEDLSIVKGRSMCEYCGHKLEVRDLIPLFSWLSLGGKCRYCSVTLSWQYPLIELLTAALFIMTYLYWPNSLSGFTFESAIFGVWLASLVIGVALAVYDFRWMELPDKLVKLLGIFGGLFAMLSIKQSSLSNFWTLVIGLVLAVAVSGGIFYILYQISDRIIGGGDVKMGLVLGLFLLTPVNSLIMLFLSSLLGTFYAFLLLLAGRYKQGVHIPFGPFLLLATYIVVIFGETLVNQYETLILLR